MAVHELELFAADGPAEWDGHRLEESMAEHVASDEVLQVGVVVTEHVGCVEIGKSVQQWDTSHDQLTQARLPELKQVTDDDQFTVFALHVIKELLELLGPVTAFVAEVVTWSAVTDVQIADNEDRSVVWHNNAPFHFANDPSPHCRLHHALTQHASACRSMAPARAAVAHSAISNPHSPIKLAQAGLEPARPEGQGILNP